MTDSDAPKPSDPFTSAARLRLDFLPWEYAARATTAERVDDMA
ncbi:MAG TPA: hypothetical protein VFT31_01050 [Kribbella sp.]|nr:hypothetical protein [Kribbella sp.]